MPTGMRITLVISSMRAGGAERVMSILANGLAARGHQVSLLTWEPPGAEPFYALDPSIRSQNLGLEGSSASVLQAVWKNANRMRALRRAIRSTHPDAVISFMDRCNVVTLIALLGSGIPVVVSERADPNIWDPGRWWRLLRSFAYPFSRRIVVQSQGARRYFSASIQAKAEIIPNPVQCRPEGPARVEGAELLRLTAMGRLKREKGFDILLAAWKRLLAAHPQWELHIIGEGEERASLSAAAQALAEQPRVFFHGLIKDPFNLLQTSDLFVLPSRVEGFPNALCEAMACGLPVVAAECTDSIPMIVEEGISGLLVPPESVDALVSALDRLMSDPEARRRMGRAARSVLDRFSESSVLDRWEELIKGIVPEASRDAH